MKIYTRTGDAGTTALFGSDRVVKTHPRIEAYGTVDEANSHLGLARALLARAAGADTLIPVLGTLQEELFEVGADLATPPDARASVPRITAEHVRRLEATIDRFEADLPALKQFILPGGSPAGAALHVARTVCRRAERLTVGATQTEPINAHALVYLNRLSDLLFVLARWVNHQAGTPEPGWKPESR